MLAFAPPLSHNQAADGPASTSAAVRSRPTSRPCTHTSVAPSTASNHSIYHSNSKRTFKSTSTATRGADDHFNKPPLWNGCQLDHPPHPEPASSADEQSPRTQPSSSALENIHEQDPNKLLQLLASLLQRIASANDQIPSQASTPSTSGPPSPSTDPDAPAPISPSGDHTPIWSALTSASRQAFSTPTSCLAFHARNIPTITLEAYLLRILKYCPTTNEVFLSLLVYFDRMSRLAFDVTGKTFIIDSFNVHRLVIAGVTVASKFFSDVFYTNSRYAKVGGLPQSELNQLELQFLLLNDFRLSIPVEEMQRYAERLQIYAQDLKSGPEIVSDVRSQPFQASTNPRDFITMSMRRMGAADAYGGRLPGEPMSEAETVQETYGGVVGYHKALELERKASELSSRQETPERHSREPSAESNAETEEGVETDDEPTIRADSSAGSETQSLCTVESEDTLSEREPDDDDENDVRIPERGGSMMNS